MYEYAFYLTVISLLLTLYSGVRLKFDKDRTIFAFFLLSIIFSLRGIVLHGYFNTPLSDPANTMLRAFDYLLSAFIPILGLELVKSNLYFRSKQLSKRQLYLFYVLFAAIPLIASISVFLVGVESTHSLLVMFGLTTFVILFVVFAGIIHSSPLKVERPEISKGARLIFAGYITFFVGEGIVAGIFRQIDLGFIILSSGMLLVFSGVVVIRNVTFSGIYKWLDVSFILAYGDSEVAMTNLSGVVEEGSTNSLGVQKARAVLEKIGSSVRKCIQTGLEVVIPEITLDMLSKTKVYQVSIQPFSVTRDGFVFSTIIILKDVTKTIEEREAIHLRQTLKAIVQERDKVFKFADLLQHDISNMLQGITMGLEITATNLDFPQAAMEGLEYIQLGVDRISQIIESARMFLKLDRSGVEVQQLDVKDLIYKAESNVRIKFPYQRFRFGVQCPENIPPVLAEPILEQCFITLIALCIGVQNDELKRINIAVSTDGKTVKVEFITFESVLGETSYDDVFEWHARSILPGTGLALPVVKLIVQRSSGLVYAEPRIPGKPEAGERFVIVLPAIQSSLLKNHNLETAKT